MAGQQTPGTGDMTLIAYPLEPPSHLLLPPSMPLVPAPLRREWMDTSADRYAYRCLPLLIANQAGWLALNNHEVRVT